MRLNSIKLSGFKSFVEPTNFMLPGQLVGVVGPNGCGKSNIIDAVRWVLGESRASELRGNTMQDVIFNGTQNRKPASRSSVELMFDNTDHRAGGQWNQFTEIAVKRILTRDGASSYYINNQPVRRRDVQDVFLGTGLGPRAYAIIGQGTITRIIDSKPEELRLFLEEAAGVSKYKERRREAENRLADTRTNLTRVEDILRELNVSLDKLEKQAEAAQQFHHLNQQLQLRQQQLWFLKHQEALSSQVALAGQVAQSQTDLEARIADLRRIESELETVRQAHYSAGDRVNQAQGLLYEANAEVGRLEAEIRFMVETRQRAQSRLEQLTSQRQMWLHNRESSQAEMTQLTADAEILAGQRSSLAADVEQSRQQLPALESDLSQAQLRTNNQQSQLQQFQQQIQVLNATQRADQQQISQLETRKERILTEQQTLQTVDTQGLVQLQTQFNQLRQADVTVLQAVQSLEAQVSALEEKRRIAQNQFNHEKTQHAESSARLEVLRTLQEKLGLDGKIQPWLKKHGLDGLPALWQKIRIQPGWENALEAALRDRLQALAISSSKPVESLIQDPPPAKLNLYALTQTTDTGLLASEMPQLAELLQVAEVEIQALLHDWLQACYTATDMDQALSLRMALPPGAMIYTRQGHAVSRYGVHFYAPDNEQSGFLARAKDIENLVKQTHAQASILEESRLALERLESDYTNTSQKLQLTRRESQQLQSQTHQCELEFNRMTQLVEQHRQRRQQIDLDLNEIDAHLLELKQRKAMSQTSATSLDQQLSNSQSSFDQVRQQAHDAQARLDIGRQQLRTIEHALQEADFATRTLSARQAELLRSVETAVQQLDALNQQEHRLHAELEGISAAESQEKLQQALALKVEREQALAAFRNQYEELTSRLKHNDEQRLLLERDLEPMRRRTTELQLKEQAARMGLEQYSQFLRDADANLVELERSVLEQGIRMNGLNSEIDGIQRKILDLGAVNLAALDELANSRERKNFLDIQTSDLTEAMETLVNAIHKIDGETRELLSHTFNIVNEHFGRMFPDLFGGGNARLVMSGVEILDAGVQVMAQPPGKKNQTIQLLSGGEKALTAIALVFAIFQLNPAPFCLLDEVDAPLDDANTDRYVRLVTKMSSDTQFLFISHNKIAMEMAEQLIGVTMQEPGVSRIVAVDMQSALSLAQSN